MGNRATVIFWNGESRRYAEPGEACTPEFSPATYLHWNGGPESVYAFLAELERRETRADQEYEAARFVQLVGEFFDYCCANPGHSGLSLGVANGPEGDWPAALEAVRTDHGDNGFYLVDRTAKAVEHARRAQAGEASCDLGWVRRFTERHYKADDYDDERYVAGYGSEERYELCEWSPEAVAREREEAWADETYRAIGLFFQSLDAKLDVLDPAEREGGLTPTPIRAS